MKVSNNTKGNRSNKKSRPILIVALALAVLMILASCGSTETAADPATTDTTSSATADTSANAAQDGSSAVTDLSADALAALGLDIELRDKWDGSRNATVTFTDSAANAEGTGVTVSGTTATVTDKGAYVFTGSCADGQIIVDSQENVTIVLDGLDLTSKTSAAIYVKSAKNAIICLADGSVNSLSDSSGFTYSDAEAEEPGATVFSKDDLFIIGSGSLAVTAVFNNGIQSKDELIIQSGNITVNAANDGIKGKDCVVITSGTLNVTAGGDGIVSTNTEDASRGYIAVTGGAITVTAAEDAISAITAVNIADGVFDITTGNGAGEMTTSGGDFGGGRSGGWGGDWSASSGSDEPSAKGIKSDGDLNITGGTFTLDCEDDAIHANGNVTVTGGTITAATGDDGIHADYTATISGGTITVTQSNEGVEANVINQAGGTVTVTASDDGYNATTADGEKGLLNVTGGTVHVNSYGDGLDSNGSATMSGGYVTVSGPTNNGNGSLDYDVSFTVTGGTLIACGSSGMAQSVTAKDGAAVIAANVGNISEGTPIGVIDSDGEVIDVFTPEKTYATFVFASDLLTSGETYTVATGGTYNGSSWTGYTELGAVTAN